MNGPSRLPSASAGPPGAPPAGTDDAARSARRAETSLATWLERGLRVCALGGRIGFGLLALVGVAALTATLAGGRLGPLGVASEWRALGPAIASGLAHAAAMAFTCERSAAVLSTLRAGDPFVDENAGRLRAIGFALAALEVARMAIQGATALTLALAGPPEGARMDVDLGIGFATWGAVAVLFLLAHVFREGARLRRLDQLTI